MKSDVIVEHIKASQKTLSYTVAKDQSITVVVVIAGSQDCTIDVSVHLVGNKSSATIVGVVCSSGGNINFHTLQHHGARETTSNLLVKTVLTHGARLSYEGGILVDAVAQKTDAYQRNENLLIGDAARATSKPALEILANDVRCTHGATIGSLDPEQVWYMASRGIGETKAMEMISRGFLMASLKNIEQHVIYRVEKILDVIYKDTYV